jgi:hypothetical protein
MKKIILGVFVLTLLLTNTNQAKASIVDDLLFQIKSLRTELSLLKSNQSASVLGATADTTPRIMYWSGKINQHIDVNGVWQTDPDGKSGAGIDKLTYCKKWFPNTVSVQDYMNETISTWRIGGNTGAYTSTKMSTKCVQRQIIDIPIPIPTPETSGSISASSCVIQAGKGTCVSNIKWNVINAKPGTIYKVITSNPNKPGSVEVVGKGNNGSVSYNLGYQKQVFAVVDYYDINKVLKIVESKSSCVVGTTWNGSSACMSNKMSIPINGGWTNWVDSGSCINGLQTQIRTCTNPFPANGGVWCVGASTQKVSCTLNQPEILIFVDSKMFLELSYELNQFKNDLIKEEYKVTVINTASYPTKESIRNYIQSKQNSLAGVFFVGNIPIVKYVYGGNGFDPYLTTDYYYKDFEKICDIHIGDFEKKYEKDISGEVGVKMSIECEGAPFKSLSKFWITRLMPPTSTDQIASLKKYFERNHSYRMGNIKGNDKILMYYPIAKDSGDERDLSEVEGSPNHPPYPTIDSLSNGLDIFLQKILLPYDIVYIQAHGNQTSIVDITNNERLSSDQINNGNALLYFFSSCSVGDFSNPNYITGSVLFNTNALFVEGCSVIHFGGWGTSFPETMLLKDGMPIGEALRETSFLPRHMCFNFFGDPTIRLSKMKNQQPVFSIDKKIINLGDIVLKKCTNCSNTEYSTRIDNIALITNRGFSDLFFAQSMALFGQSLDTGFSYDNKQIALILGSLNSYRILPNKASNLYINIVVSNNQSGPISGEFHILTNDPNHPVNIIPFTANIILED